MISESQYKKVKQALIENAINKSLLNEIGLGGENEPNYDISTPTNTTPVKTNTNKPTNSGDLSYTVQSKEVFFENANNSRYPELKIFKGAKFTPIFKDKTFMGKLMTTTKMQWAVSESWIGWIAGQAAGEVVPKWNSDDNEELMDYNNKYSTRTEKIYFNCETSRFTVPTASPEPYFGEDAPAPQLVKELKNLCQRAKTSKSSYGSDAVGGGKSYNQKNNYTLKSKDGKTLIIPAKTGYSFKPENKGASFRLGNKFGWFSCTSKTFKVDGVIYLDDKKYLSNELAKSLCGTTSKVVPDKIEGTSKGSGASGSTSSSSELIADFQNYI